VITDSHVERSLEVFEEIVLILRKQGNVNKI